MPGVQLAEFRGWRVGRTLMLWGCCGDGGAFAVGAGEGGTQYV